MTIETFREEIREWLNENYTAQFKSSAEGSEDRREWIRRLADKGWIAPHWPKEYGGGGLNFQEHIALIDIRESLQELIFYRENYFIPQEVIVPESIPS